jgi:ABC-type dipeptide/oligopeptide/nickel transport system permease subunit
MTAGLIWPFLVHQRKTKGIKLPLDTIITKLVEVVDSLPALFVLLAWAASIQNWTIVSLSLLIAFFRWPTFTRLSRIETNKWMKGDWINSLKALNMSDRWIIGRQLLDLIIIPLSIHAAFVAAAAISIEATLSFLGFGLGAEVVSWGALLNEARQYFQAWWLVVFPGLSLFSLLWAFNELAKKSQTYVRRSRLAPPDEVN